jgi:voltage-gated potassium channel
MGERIERQLTELNLWRAVRLVVGLAATLVVVAAVLVRLVEPKTFTGMGVALWWAVVTVGTVGYGDYIPETRPGRIVGGATILFAMALIPTVTSLIAAALVTKSQRERGVSDAAQLDDIAQRLAAIEAHLASIADERRQS